MTLMKSVVAALAATAGLAASAQADTSTVPYNVAPGACGNPIAVPANNKPVSLMGTTITTGIRGEGQVTLLRANANNSLLDWAGYDYFSGFERNYTSGPDTHIMYLDFEGWVDVQTATSQHIKVCNSSSNTEGNAIGYLTFVY